MNKIYLGADTYVEVGKELLFQDTALGTGIAGATATVKLYDDQEVGGPTELTPTISLSDVAGTAGLYRGVIKDTHAGLLIGMRVRLEWDVDDGADRKMFKVTLAQVVRAK